jgi:NADH-quinone oxidoreductase subunit D
MSVSELEARARTAAHIADARVAVELQTEQMLLNIGPQHPSTHGVFRIMVRLDGERVEKAEPVLGYMHRGYEKLSEVRSYPQITTLINRIDWLSGFANEIPFILAAEQLMDIEAPPRATYIRTLLTEYARMATYLVFLGTYGIELGGITGVFWGFRDRERILDLIESVTGGRFHPNYNRIGGVKDDLPAGFIRESREALDHVLTVCDELDAILFGNEIFLARTKGVGLIPPKKGAEYGVSGPNIRAAGVPMDIRKQDAYLAYPEIDFDIITRTEGDCYARAMVRLEETRQSVRMCRQLLDKLPEGSIQAKVPRIIKVPAGEVYVRAEGPLGEMGYYVVSKGDIGPYRLKIRSPSFSNVSILPWLLEGVLVPDIIAILGSLYFILGDVDR